MNRLSQLLILAVVAGRFALAQDITPQQLPNDPTTGTTLGCWMGVSAGKAINLSTSATSGSVGFVIAGAGTTGVVTYVTQDTWPATLDNTGVVDHWVVPSSTNACQGHDTGSTTRPASGLILGRVQSSTAVSAGIYWVILSPPDTVAGGGASGTSAGAQGAVQASDGVGGFQQANGSNVSSILFAAGGGTAQAQTATFTPAITALTDGLRLCWRPNVANSGAAPTFSPNGLTARTIVKAGGSAVVANDLTTTAIACAVYNLSTTQWELQNPQTITGGGTVTATAGPLTSNQVMLGAGTTDSKVLGAAGTTTQVLHGNASGAPSFGSVVAGDIAANAVGSGQMAVVNTRRTVCLATGAKNASAALADTDLADSDAYFVPAASTVVEVAVHADAGTPNVIVGRDRAGTVVNLTSAALATAASGAIACSNTGGTTGLDATTTCSATLQNTTLAAGDWLKLVSGTAGGTAKQMSACVTLTIN